jgi:predicted MPP superfamily phosphohydrolase
MSEKLSSRVVEVAKKPDYKRIIRGIGRAGLSAAPVIARPAAVVAGATIALGMMPAHASLGHGDLELEIKGGVVMPFVQHEQQGIHIGRPLGDYGFPDVTKLPVRLDVSVEDADVLSLAGHLSDPKYQKELLSDVEAQKWPIAEKLLFDIVLGGGAGALILESLLSKNNNFKKKTGVALTSAIATTSALAGAGLATYNDHWQDSNVKSGTIGEALEFPGQLGKYYDRESVTYGVAGAISAIRSASQEKSSTPEVSDLAFRTMFISDMHLAPTGAFLEQYIDRYGVKLIIDTGDEAEFGTKQEMTPEFMKLVARLAKKAVYIYVPGNHDSPDTVEAMRSVPGVIVLGSKTKNRDGTYDIKPSNIKVFGMNIVGEPDPRVFGGKGAFGADEESPEVNRLEQDSAEQAIRAIKSLGEKNVVNLFLTHEPQVANRVSEELKDRVLVTASGHKHAQNNDPSELQTDGGIINLEEGSTGRGGMMKNIKSYSEAPIAFSIGDISSKCQLTSIRRFQFAPSQDDSGRYDRTERDYRFRAQTVRGVQACGLGQGVGSIIPIDDQQASAVEALTRSK